MNNTTNTTTRVSTTDLCTWHSRSLYDPHFLTVSSNTIVPWWKAKITSKITKLLNKLNCSRNVSLNYHAISKSYPTNCEPFAVPFKLNVALWGILECGDLSVMISKCCQSKMTTIWIKQQQCPRGACLRWIVQGFCRLLFWQYKQWVSHLVTTQHQYLTKWVRSNYFTSPLKGHRVTHLKSDT